MDPKKGLDLLLRAFVESGTGVPQASLVIAGDRAPEFDSRVKVDAATLGLNDVVWAGFVTGDEKDQMLDDADVCALPSYSENFGIAAAEAMAAGLPVVVSDQVGIHREIRAAHAGLVVPCQVGKLAVALVTLLTNSARRAALGTRGAALVKRRYSSDAVAQQLVSVYDDVVRSAGPKQGVDLASTRG